MSASKKDLEKATQARLRYEHAAVEARHVRDAAISSAWLAFEKEVAAEWALYQKAMEPIEAALRAEGL